MSKKQFTKRSNTRSQFASNISSDIKNNIQILPELRDLIPPLSSEDREQLRQNIQKENRVREALIVWDKDGEYFLVDGHNRYSILSDLKFTNEQWKIDARKFESLEVVRSWMLHNQLGRRNLTPSQASFLRGQLYHQIKKDEGGQKGNFNAQKQLSQNDQVESELKGIPPSQNDQVELSNTKSTASILAEQTKVSPKTIQRDALFTTGVNLIGENNPKLKEEILKGNVKIKKSDIQAVGAGKKSVQDIIKPDNNTEKTSQKRTVYYKKEQIEIIETSKQKINNTINDLKKIGLSKNDIKSILISELK